MDGQRIKSYSLCEIMKDIELIEKYARQRQKYRKWDFYANDTDIQRLGRLETACWTSTSTARISGDAT